MILVVFNGVFSKVKLKKKKTWTCNLNLQQYTPAHEHVAPHESWQMEQLGDYPRQQNVQWNIGGSFRADSVCDVIYHHLNCVKVSIQTGPRFLIIKVLLSLFVVWISVEIINCCLAILQSYQSCYLFFKGIEQTLWNANMWFAISEQNLPMHSVRWLR